MCRQVVCRQIVFGQIVCRQLCVDKSCDNLHVDKVCVDTLCVDKLCVWPFTDHIVCRTPPHHCHVFNEFIRYCVTNELSEVGDAM